MEIKNFSLTGDVLVLVKEDGSTTYIKKGNPYWNQLVNLIHKGDLAQLPMLADLAGRITLHSKGQFHLKDGKVFYKDTVMPEALSNRVIQYADAGAPFKSLINFWDNCLQNPSEESRNDLFPFLDHCHIPLTEDGCFIAYKRIDENWKDCYTHEIDNSVGQKPKMKREDVDPDRNQTCSRGLHVAAFQYAHDMYQNGILIAVKVNPKDVVAVPIDYNGEKMRVCEYEVMEKVGEPRKELIYAEFKVGSVVAVLPNMDNAQDYFVGTVVKVIEKEGEVPVYQIKKVNSEEIVTFPQEHVMWLDNDKDDEDTCPDCGEEDCTCDDPDEDYDNDEDEDEDDY